MSGEITTSELCDSVRGVLHDRRGDTYPVPGSEGFGFDRNLWNQMAELGWLALGIPESAGGLGLGLTHLAVLYEELGRDIAAVPMLSTMVAAHAIANSGKSEYLGAIAAGQCVAAIALPQTHKAADRLVGGGLSGVVHDVAFADIADLLLVPVTCPDGHVLALVASDAKGVAITKRPLVDCSRSAGDVTLTDVDGTAVMYLEIDDAGESALFDHAAIGLASDAVGGALALFAMTVEYLKSREQFGRPIGSFQALKHRMADWTTKIEAMTALTRHAALFADAGDTGVSATASGAHVLACETYEAFAADAVQLHGGIGFTWEHPCHLFLKRANFGKCMFGTVTAHRERVAELAFPATGSNATLPGGSEDHES